MQFLADALQKSAGAAGDKKDNKAKPKKKKKTDKDANVAERIAKAITTVLRFPDSRGLVMKLQSKVPELPSARILFAVLAPSPWPLPVKQHV